MFFIRNNSSSSHHILAWSIWGSYCYYFIIRFLRARSNRFSTRRKPDIASIATFTTTIATQPTSLKRCITCSITQDWWYKNTYTAVYINRLDPPSSLCVYKKKFIILTVWSLLLLLWFSHVQNWLTDLEIFATIFAAIIHDFEHTGTTNNFHVMSGTETALLYNDRSVQENHHISAAFRYSTQFRII